MIVIIMFVLCCLFGLVWSIYMDAKDHLPRVVKSELGHYAVKTGKIAFGPHSETQDCFIGCDGGSRELPPLEKQFPTLAEAMAELEIYKIRAKEKKLFEARDKASHSYK